MATKEVVSAIGEYSTCDVADALQKLKVPHGGFLAGLSMWSPVRQEGETKIVGPAYTVKYVSNDDEDKSKPAGHYIDSIPSGAVLFISAPPNTINALYGGLMSNRAHASHAAGTIVDGSIRDLPEHRALSYPVFARGVGIAAPGEVVRVAATDVPIRLGDERYEAWVRPGDVLMGDINGVVCVPGEHVGMKLVELMRSQSEADERIAEDIKSGATFSEASKRHRAGVMKP